MTNNGIPIEGFCDTEFAAVKETFYENFSSRNEIGAGVCVYKDGEKVVDLWGGHKDEDRQNPWTEETIVLMNSVAKSMCALAVHALSDQGKLNINAPVAEYWPEFAQNGKSHILVRHVLGHECGAIFSDQAVPGDWFNYPAQCAAIAAQEPAFEAGTKGAYNTINIGFILGEVVRHVSGKSIGQFIRDEISGPLGAEYNIGLSPEESDLCATMHLNPENVFWSDGAQPGSNLHRAWSGRPERDDLLNCSEIREGELPAFGGHGNARGVAKIYAMLAGDGEVEGIRILKPKTVEQASKLVWQGTCYMTGWDLRMGLGFEHNSPPYIAMGNNMSAFGKLGSGGALGFCDRERNLAFSYCTNFQCEGAGTGIRCRLLGEAAAGVAQKV